MYVYTYSLCTVIKEKEFMLKKRYMTTKTISPIVYSCNIQSVNTQSALEDNTFRAMHVPQFSIVRDCCCDMYKLCLCQPLPPLDLRLRLVYDQDCLAKNRTHINHNVFHDIKSYFTMVALASLKLARQKTTCVCVNLQELLSAV
jgi:hypothetical protein